MPLFGKAWQVETGITDEAAQSNMLRTHGLAFLMMACIACGLNIIVNYHPLEEQTFMHGALHGVMPAAFYGLPLLAINYLYQRSSLKLFLIDAAYAALFFGLMGGVLALLKLG